MSTELDPIAHDFPDSVFTRGGVYVSKRGKASVPVAAVAPPAASPGTGTRRSTRTSATRTPANRIVDLRRAEAESDEAVGRAARSTGMTDRDLSLLAHNSRHELLGSIQAVAGFSDLVGRRAAVSEDATAGEYVDWMRIGIHKVQHVIEALVAYLDAGVGSDVIERVDCE